VHDRKGRAHVRGCSGRPEVLLQSANIAVLSAAAYVFAVGIGRGAVIAIGLAVVALAGCATTQTQTLRAAESLERNAKVFAAGTCDEPNAGCSANRYLPAARAFADQTQRFGDTLRGAGDPQVVLAFERLWRSYHTLRDEVARARDPRVRADLKPVTRTFIDVQRHVKNG